MIFESLKQDLLKKKFIAMLLHKMMRFNNK